jgi:hypothetical protein
MVPTMSSITIQILFAVIIHDGNVNITGHFVFASAQPGHDHGLFEYVKCNHHGFSCSFEFSGKMRE